MEVGVLFIDCSKAFESIDHQILKQKLKAIGITGQLYHLLESYLEDRQQFTEVNGVASELRKVKYGVPQGSLLGPRMFSIYMNDISELDSDGEIHLYADDITAFVIGKTTDDAVNKMQCLANEITQWCVKNRITINAKKTDAMIIQKNTFVGPLKPIEIASNTVNYKTECKLLGVYIDSKLTWNTQIEKVRRKFTVYNAMLRKITFLPSETLEKIYFTMIVPKITYGLVVWGTCSNNLLQKIECQHIKAARLVRKTNEKVKDVEVLQRANWNNIEYIYKRKIAVEMYKIVKGAEDHRLEGMYTIKCNKRRGEKVEIERLKSETERNTLKYRGSILWNMLNSDLKSADNLLKFKKSLTKNCKIIEKISFSKGTTVNVNKDLDNFVYF